MSFQHWRSSIFRGAQKCKYVGCGSGREGFGGFTILTELIITGFLMLLSSANERFSLPPSAPDICIEFLPKRLQPYFPENRSSLRFLSVRESPDLQSLRLHCCMALQELQIQSCREVAALEGMQYLRSLRVLSIDMSPELSASWVRRCQDMQQGSGHTHLLPRSLEELSIGHVQDGLAPYLLAHGTFLSTLVVEGSPNLTSLQLGSFAALRNLRVQDCGSLTSLQGVLPKLEVCLCDSQNLTSLQLGALTALEDMTVYSCDWVTSLETLALFRNLADLAIYECRSIGPLLELLTQQPECSNVFPRLERLYANCLSALAMPFFKHLTSLGLSTHLKLPEKGLPPSLEVMEINDCSVELQEQYRMCNREAKGPNLQLSSLNWLLGVSVAVGHTFLPVQQSCTVSSLFFALQEFGDHAVSDERTSAVVTRFN